MDASVDAVLERVAQLHAAALFSIGRRARRAYAEGMATTLVEVEQLARELSPVDQARLIQFLAPRVAAAVSQVSTDPDSTQRASEAWQRMRSIGERLAASSKPGDGSVTDAVSEMRR